MNDGKRYQNPARQSKETLIHEINSITLQHCKSECQSSNPESGLPVLSSSIAPNFESAATTTIRSNSESSQPNLYRHDSATSQDWDKKITRIDLRIFKPIQEKKTIEPLSSPPIQLAPQAHLSLKASEPAKDAILRPSSSPSAALISEGTSLPVDSKVSTSTDLSLHRIVRGFDPNCISTFIHSSPNLNPAPTLKTSSFITHEAFAKVEPVTRKQLRSTVGGSLDETSCSSLTDNFKDRGMMRKIMSFKNEVITCDISDVTPESEEAIESAIESESEEESDSNAIDEEDWEDDNDESEPSNMTELTFQRVDLRPNWTSRLSLLTLLMRNGNLAQALQSAASRSTPAIRRSRTSTPNGPSTGNSSQEDSGLMMKQQIPRSKPIIMITSNSHSPALLPRTTRHNMLQRELTQSLRQNLLWERQQKNATTNAVNKRDQSAISISSDADNQYFDQGLQEYHQKGW